MSLADKLTLGLNTTVIGMGIVFLVLIALSIIVSIQSKLVSIFIKDSDKDDDNDQANGREEPQMKISDTEKKGATTGETVLIGVENEETVALIMAAVSNEANVPLSQLKFISITAI